MADSEDCLAAWCADDEWCPITCTAAIVRRKWHPVIVSQLLERGPLGFNRLKSHIGAISGTVLSDSLERLEDHGVVERSIVSEKPVRVEYALTDRGRDLEPVIDAMYDWGRTYAAKVQ